MPQERLAKDTDADMGEASEQVTAETAPMTGALQLDRKEKGVGIKAAKNARDSDVSMNDSDDDITTQRPSRRRSVVKARPKDTELTDSSNDPVLTKRGAPQKAEAKGKGEANSRKPSVSRKKFVDQTWDYEMSEDESQAPQTKTKRSTRILATNAASKLAENSSNKGSSDLSDPPLSDEDMAVEELIVDSIVHKPQPHAFEQVTGVDWDPSSSIVVKSTQTMAAFRSPVKMSKPYKAIGKDTSEDELAGLSDGVKKVKLTVRGKDNADSARKSRSKWDDVDELLTNPKSPLAIADLFKILTTNKKAWDGLGPDGQKKILAMLPSDQVLDAGTENARPNNESLRSNTHYRHDIAQYQRDLADGKHDPEYIRQGQAAHGKREAGLYDEYLRHKFKEDWEMEMPAPPEAGADIATAETESKSEVTVEVKGESIIVATGEGEDAVVINGDDKNSSLSKEDETDTSLAENISKNTASAEGITPCDFEYEY